MKPIHVVLAAIASLVVSVLALWLILAPTSGTTGNAPGAASASALHRDHVATIGNPDAKVHLVEFLDPACEACRAFYPFVKQLMAANPDRIRLSVRMVGFHKGADVAVGALEAAKLQGKFWPVLERLLATQSRWVTNHVVRPELVWEQLKTMDLDLDRLKSDMESPQVARNVALDLQDAKALKVAKTPEYFVNGKTMPTFGYEQLQELVSKEVANAYR
jgi:protein-disulfide isomerase